MQRSTLSLSIWYLPNKILGGGAVSDAAEKKKEAKFCLLLKLEIE